MIWGSTDLALGFRYTPICSVVECRQPAVVKLVASWSYGPLRELKNYGLACETHREMLLARARIRRKALALGDDEQVGSVEAVELFTPNPASTA